MWATVLSGFLFCFVLLVCLFLMCEHKCFQVKKYVPITGECILLICVISNRINGRLFFSSSSFQLLVENKVTSLLTSSQRFAENLVRRQQGVNIMSRSTPSDATSALLRTAADNVGQYHLPQYHLSVYQSVSLCLFLCLC